MKTLDSSQHNGGISADRRPGCRAINRSVNLALPDSRRVDGVEARSVVMKLSFSRECLILDDVRGRTQHNRGPRMVKRARSIYALS